MVALISRTEHGTLLSFDISEIFTEKNPFHFLGGIFRDHHYKDLNSLHNLSFVPVSSLRLDNGVSNYYHPQ